MSPLLANIYLNPLDHLVAAEGCEMVRYADDFVVLCRTKSEAEHALAIIRHWVDENGLVLHPVKTQLVELTPDQGFDFLGYHFRPSRKTPGKVNRWPRKKSLKRLRDSIRPLTRRSNRHGVPCVIHRLNPILRGWFGYYQHSSNDSDFRTLDGWIRTRLRSILRRHRKRKGRARAPDKRRWPNAYFAARGLFSLQDAFAAARQSSSR